MADEHAVVIHADFWNDVRVHVLGALTQAGITLGGDDDPEDAHAVCRAYFNVAQKVIWPRPRTVHYSRELRERTLPGIIETGVRLIETRSLAGESLAEHLSARAKRTHTHDWLLNDWGIHHLHVRPAKGDELLYVWEEPATLHFIDVRGHDAMADLDLLEIVLANWPALLHFLPSISGGKAPSAAEIIAARRVGVTAFFPLSNGRVPFPRGRGVTTAAGSSVRAVERADRVLDEARCFEEHYRANAQAFAAEIDVNELRLRYDPAGSRVIETVTGHVWKLRKRHV